MSDSVKMLMDFNEMTGENGVKSAAPANVVISGLNTGGGWSQTGMAGTTSNRNETTLAMDHIDVTRIVDTSTSGILQVFGKGTVEKAVIKAIAANKGDKLIVQYDLENASIASWGFHQTAGRDPQESLQIVCSMSTTSGNSYDEKGNQSGSIRTEYDYTGASSNA